MLQLWLGFLHQLGTSCLMRSSKTTWPCNLASGRKPDRKPWQKTNLLRHRLWFTELLGEIHNAAVLSLGLVMTLADQTDASGIPDDIDVFYGEVRHAGLCYSMEKKVPGTSGPNADSVGP